MDAVLRRIEQLQAELVQIREELDLLSDNDFYNYSRLISNINARNKELNILETSYLLMNHKSSDRFERPA